MDVCKSEKHAAVDSRRLPLVPAERNGNAQSTLRRPRTREISSRYKSPAPSTPRRCSSPSQSRTLPTVSQAVPKRAQSAERRRPSTPPSPQSPSTPVRDSSVDVQLPSRRLSTGGRLPESLWPSTMRSLSVSFQSDTISIPISKKEKPVNNISSDRTLRPSSNVAHKQEEAPPGSRKPTPERKRSPLKGKNVQDQSENAKPVEGLHGRLIDQHRWPSRVGGKISSNSLNKSVDQSDKAAKSLSTPGIGSTSLRRLSVPGGSIKPLQKSAGDAATLSSLEDISRRESEASSADDCLLQVSGSQKLVAASLSERWHLQIPAVRTQSLPSPGLQSPSPSRTSFPNPRLHPPSPSRTSLPSHGLHPPSPSRTAVSRGASPARTRPSTPPSRGVSPTRRGISPTPSRGVSPTGSMPSSVSSQMDNSISVFSFIVDFKKGKKAGNYMEDVHQIRLLHNRYLQWRFANARAEAALYIQEETAENTLYNVWNTALTLWDSVIRKRINLERIKLEHKLSTILNHQTAYLDEWALMERDHTSSLAGAVEDLEATTLRVPVTGGAKADMNSLKAAISSAVDVMQAMGSSICSSLSKAEGVNRLVSELAIVAAQEKAMLDECNALLASTAALQVEQYSICTHLIQTKQVLEHQPVLAAKGPY